MKFLADQAASSDSFKARHGVKKRKENYLTIGLCNFFSPVWQGSKKLLTLPHKLKPPAKFSCGNLQQLEWVLFSKAGFAMSGVHKLFIRHAIFVADQLVTSFRSRTLWVQHRCTTKLVVVAQVGKRCHSVWAGRFRIRIWNRLDHALPSSFMFYHCKIYQL